MELTKDGLAALRVSALWAGDDGRVSISGYAVVMVILSIVSHLLTHSMFFHDTFETADQRAGMYYPDSCSDRVVVLRLWHTGIPGRISPDL